MVRRERGFTLLETVFALAIFGILIFMLTVMTAEMRGNDKRYPLNYMRHPQVSSVLSRMRRDVLDATQPMYPDPFIVGTTTYKQSPETLIIYSMQPSGFPETVVWDFSIGGVATRRSFNVGAQVSQWMARGLPSQFTIDIFEIPGRPYGVRVQARDKAGQLAIDQIFQPRAH